MLKNLLVVSAILTSVGAYAAETQNPVANEEKGPDAVEHSQTIQAEAKVMSVNKKTREIKLKTPSGEEMAITAGPEVRNFDQIKKGDTLKVNYFESLVFDLKKGGGAPETVNETSDLQRAPVGQKPGGVAVDKVKARGTITKLDKKTQEVTVRGPHRTISFHVNKPEVFKKLKVGDQIEATYTEALAVSVETTKK
jgi:hypothetical protein